MHKMGSGRDAGERDVNFWQIFVFQSKRRWSI